MAEPISTLARVSDQHQPGPEPIRAPGAPFPYAPPPIAPPDESPTETIFPAWPASAPTAPPGWSWWRGLPGATKAAVVGAAAVLCLGGIAIAGVVHDPQPAPPPPVFAQPAAGAELPVTTDPGSVAPLADGSPGALADASPTVAPQPTVETRTVTEEQQIPFTETTVSDASLPAGTRKVRTPGVAGVRTVVYEVTLTNGRQTAKRMVRETISAAPVTQVVAIGTREQQCDPNYRGACVPIASDVDCLGAGRGPVYVQGPVQVVGSDIYRLDRNHDGIGCNE